ncbi:hypothetical protein EJB05_52556, partial [Eragrostis curvula]
MSQSDYGEGDNQGLFENGKEEVELQKKLEVEICQGEKLKAKKNNCGEKVIRTLNNDFDGMGLEDLKSFHDKLDEVQSIFKDRT